MKNIRTSLPALLVAVIMFVSASTAQRRPNIIYILADDLGYGDLGCYGQQKIETPNIDALAKAGKRFTQHYVASPICAPSRYSLMTGVHSGKAYIRGNDEWDERGDVWSFKAMEANPFLEGQRPVPGSTITVAKVLQAAGYTTALVGKWGLGGPFTNGQPNKQGFDYFYGFLCQRQDHTYYTAHLWENEMRVPLDNDLVDPQVRFPKDKDSLDEKNYEGYQQKEYTPDLLIKAALNFIDKNAGKPFFLYYPSPLPHVSLQAPKKWVDYYHKKFGEETPYMGGGYFPCRYPRATYAAMISALDEQVGQIVAALKQKGIYNNTIVMFCSDNGTAYGNDGVDGPYFDSGGPFRSETGWGKGTLHEGGIREPFIVAWPGKVKAGSTSDMISATIDMMPTFCALANIKAPSNTDGINMLPEITGKRQPQHSYLYWEFPGFDGQLAVRMGNWKGLMTNIRRSNKTMQWQLFDLSNDLQEQHDLAAQYPTIIQQFDAIVRKEHYTPELSKFSMPVLEEKFGDGKRGK